LSGGVPPKDSDVAVDVTLPATPTQALGDESMPIVPLRPLAGADTGNLWC